MWKSIASSIYISTSHCCLKSSHLFTSQLTPSALNLSNSYVTSHRHISFHSSLHIFCRYVEKRVSRMLNSAPFQLEIHRHRNGCTMSWTYVRTHGEDFDFGASFCWMGTFWCALRCSIVFCFYCTAYDCGVLHTIVVYCQLLTWQLLHLTPARLCPRGSLWRSCVGIFHGNGGVPGSRFLLNPAATEGTYVRIHVIL